MWITNIDWDTDGLTIHGLPTEVDAPDGDYDIADWLSDNYGFCVFSYETE